MKVGILSSRQDVACRAAAIETFVQLSLPVTAPVDPAQIADKLQLRILPFHETVDLDGRLVASPNEGGTIRVRCGESTVRRRFTIAHEVGHYQIHCRAPDCIIDSMLDETFDSEKEAEAHAFASELLMPKPVFSSLLRNKAPSLALIDSLSAAFQTSFTATLFQFWTHTDSCVAVVISRNGIVTRFYPFRHSHLRLRYKGKINSQSPSWKPSGGPQRVPLSAWIMSAHQEQGQELWEDSRYLEVYGSTISLLWCKESSV
jgi:hypothetical protein